MVVGGRRRRKDSWSSWFTESCTPPPPPTPPWTFKTFWGRFGGYRSPSPDTYLDEGCQQHAAHLLLQDHLVVVVVVAGRDEGGEQHSDQVGVAEVLEGQLTEFLQDAGLAARLHDHLQHTAGGISQTGHLWAAAQAVNHGLSPSHV